MSSRRSRSASTKFSTCAGGTNTRLHVGFRGNNRFTYAFWGNDLNMNKTYADDLDEWHWWVGTYDANTNTQNLYRDGGYIQSRIAPTDYQGLESLMTIGCRNDNYNGKFHGSIDEVAILGKLLTTVEIGKAYAKPTN